MNLFTDAQHLAFIRRLGAVALTFFLVKGLLWLAAPVLFLWLV